MCYVMPCTSASHCLHKHSLPRRLKAFSPTWNWTLFFVMQTLQKATTATLSRNCQPKKSHLACRLICKTTTTTAGKEDQCCQLSQIIQETPDFVPYLPVSRLESDISWIIAEVAISCRLNFSTIKFQIFRVVWVTINMERFSINSGMPK